MRKSKIVCTIGPATETEEMLEKVMNQGMNVARINFSHQTQKEHKVRFDTIKKVREKLDKPVSIMLDTKGPEVRTGDFENGEVEVKTGDEFVLTTKDILGTNKISKITYENLPQDVEVGDFILIDDGLIELEVISKDNEEVTCLVKNGGTITNHKGVNIPGVNIGLPSLTEKDKEDIIFGIEEEVDYIAASFIRKARDVIAIREILEENGGGDIQIISKIENREGVDNIDEIIDLCEGIMIGRGDLGVEIPPEEVPLVQKMIIQKCNEAGKPVITATQMLDSMMRNPRPTRAEVTDIANAIIDGSDCIMLSGETAAGKYPEESVKTMHNIAVKIEDSLDYEELLRSKSIGRDITITNAISHASCSTAQDLGAEAIVTPTSSGYTAMAVAKYRPQAVIIATTPSEKVMRGLSLTWGVYPVKSKDVNSTDEIVNVSVDAIMEKGYLKQGDLIVITAGVPVGEAGSTNLIKVHTIGEPIIKGTGIGSRTATGVARVGHDLEKFKSSFKDGDIIVSISTDKEMMGYIEKASGIIVEEGGVTSHAAIVGLSLGIPVIVGAKDATDEISDGETITMDSDSGLVYRGKAQIL